MCKRLQVFLLPVLVLAAGLPVLAQVPPTDPPKAPQEPKLQPADKAVVEGGTFKGELKQTAHPYTVTAGQQYVIKVKAKNFRPIIHIKDKNQQGTYYTNSNSNLSVAANGQQEWFQQFAWMPQPNQAGEVNFVIGQAFGIGTTGQMDYSITVSKMKTLLSVSEQLASSDPHYGLRGSCYHKVHTVDLKAGTTYQIDLAGNFNPFLYVEDALGNVLRSDDNGSGTINARIYFQPAKTDVYRLIATSSGPGATGPYTLTVSDAPFAVGAGGGIGIGGGPVIVNPGVPFNPAPNPIPLPKPIKGGLPKLQPPIRPDLPMEQPKPEDAPAKIKKLFKPDLPMEQPKADNVPAKFKNLEQVKPEDGRGIQDGDKPAQPEPKKDEPKKDEPKKGDRKADDDETVFQGQLQASSHTLKMTSSQQYAFKLKAKSFQPQVYIRNAANKQVVFQRSGGSWNGIEYSLNFSYTPAATAEYTVEIFNLPGGNPQGKMEYVLDVGVLKLVFSKTDTLNNNDPMYAKRQGCFHKTYEVELKASVNYQIDLVGPFDPYLYLEDAAGNVLRADDDSGGNLNSRIVFQPGKTEKYKIIVTSCGGGATGQFNLTVSDTPGLTGAGGFDPGFPGGFPGGGFQPGFPGGGVIQPVPPPIAVPQPFPAPMIPAPMIDLPVPPGGFNLLPVQIEQAVPIQLDPNGRPVIAPGKN